MRMLLINTILLVTILLVAYLHNHLTSIWPSKGNEYLWWAQKSRDYRELGFQRIWCRSLALLQISSFSLSVEMYGAFVPVYASPSFIHAENVMPCATILFNMSCFQSELNVGCVPTEKYSLSSAIWRHQLDLKQQQQHRKIIISTFLYGQLGQFSECA